MGSCEEEGAQEFGRLGPPEAREWLPALPWRVLPVTTRPPPDQDPTAFPAGQVAAAGRGSMLVCAARAAG